MLASATPSAGQLGGARRGADRGADEGADEGVDDGVSASDVPAGPDWLHEVKWDGMRVLVDVQDGDLRVSARSESDVTVAFPELAGLAEVLPDALLDGEIVAMVDGHPSFTALAERMHVQDRRKAERLAAARPVVLMIFDVLRLYGVSLLDRPLEERRATLERLELAGPSWQVPPAYDDGPALFAATREQGLEGIVSKRRSSTYQPGRRSKDWVKLPHRRVQSCVVGGWRPETGSRNRIGALLLGIPQPAAPTELDFVGRVGSGIGGKAAERLAELLTPLDRPTSPFRDQLPRMDVEGSRWSEPQIVVEVRYLRRTEANRLRQPTYRGLRTDLSPADVRWE
jgi:bifunctional non-homologous end joining protein LigD